MIGRVMAGLEAEEIESPDNSEEVPSADGDLNMQPCSISHQAPSRTAPRFTTKGTVKDIHHLDIRMSDGQPRSEGGRFGEKVTEQDILKVFDAAEAPFLTTAEIAEELPVSSDAVYRRLERMCEKKLVGKKKTGARSVGWWATVAPRLDPAVADRAASADREDAISLEDLDAEFDAA